MSDPKNNDPEKFINKYDRILKENIPALPNLATKILDLLITKSEPVEWELFTTTARKTDHLKKITDETGEKFVFHLEYETGCPKKMAERMGEYHGIVVRRENLPVKHFVLYLGEPDWTEPTELAPDLVYTGYKLISLKDEPLKQFLESKVPEEVIFAILAKYHKDDAEDVIRRIIQRLKVICKCANDKRKYLEQLTMLSRLRNLEALVKEISTEMPITFGNRDHTKDHFYVLGQEAAKKEMEVVKREAEKKLEAATLNLLEMGFHPQQVANILTIELGKVIAIKEGKL